VNITENTNFNGDSFFYFDGKRLTDFTKLFTLSFYVSSGGPYCTLRKTGTGSGTGSGSGYLVPTGKKLCVHGSQCFVSGSGTFGVGVANYLAQYTADVGYGAGAFSGSGDEIHGQPLVIGQAIGSVSFQSFYAEIQAGFYPSLYASPSNPSSGEAVGVFFCTLEDA